jgi:hypothetical protein
LATSDALASTGSVAAVKTLMALAMNAAAAIAIMGRKEKE